MTAPGRLGVVLDVVAVVVFVAVGRLQHDGGEAFALGGFVGTLWPFLAALAIAAAVAASTPFDYATVSVGAAIVVATAGFGLALRYVSGQGVALSFAIVTVIVLALLMRGWRFFAGAVARHA